MKTRILVDGKISKSGLFKKAWALVKNDCTYTLSEALRYWWGKAKEALKAEQWAKRVQEAASTIERSSDYNPYNNVNIPLSAYYSGSTGLMGAKYVGD